MKSQVIISSICYDISNSVEDRPCCTESVKHPQTVDGNCVPACCKVRVTNTVQLGFLLVLKHWEQHDPPVCETDLMVTQLMPLVVSFYSQ